MGLTHDGAGLAMACPVLPAIIETIKAGYMHKLVPFLLLSAAFVVSAAGADRSQQMDVDISANTIYSGCKAFAQGLPVADKQTIVLGNYCSGVLHGLSGVSRYMTAPEWQACIPPDLPSSQLARVVVKYLDEHPQRTNEDFRRLAMEAFHEAWPCQ